MKGHVPLIISLLSSPSTRTKAARLLYLLSYDNAGRDSFAGEGVGQLAKLLGGSKCASAESGSLVVNISLADQCVQYMTKPKLVGRLVEKLAAATDEADSIFVLKVLRNMAAFTYNISTVCTSHIYTSRTTNR